MSKTFILIFIFLNINQIETQNQLQDSLFLTISPDSLKEGSSDRTIFYSIVNKTAHTFVTMQDVYVEGLTDRFYIIWPMSFKYFPNLMYISSTKYNKGIGDGGFDISYKNFPKLIVIKPQETKIVGVKLDKYDSLLSTADWKIWGIVRLCFKHDLDSIVRTYYAHRFEEYEKSLCYSNLTFVSSQNTDSIIYKNKNSNCYDSLDLIKNVFNIVIYNSEK